MYQSPPGMPPHGNPNYGGYPPPYGAPAPQGTDGRATTSLVLGIMSLVFCGLFTGIPAVVLGFSAKKSIDQSGGMVGGAGVAIGGIITGFLGTGMSVVSAIVMVLMLVVAKPMAGPTPAPYVVPTAGPVATSTVARGPHTIGRVSVTDLNPSDGTLRDQLEAATKRATREGRTVLVQTTATWCSVCREVDGSLGDPKMQTALVSVSLVRVDVDEFDAELHYMKMSEGSVPWFYKVDSTIRATDAISADEWDANIPDNMAPVLRAFVGGTLKHRRHANPMLGTPL